MPRSTGPPPQHELQALLIAQAARFGQGHLVVEKGKVLHCRAGQGFEMLFACGEVGNYLCEHGDNSRPGYLYPEIPRQR